jgi:hypothetical protein
MEFHPSPDTRRYIEKLREELSKSAKKRITLSEVIEEILRMYIEKAERERG